MKIAHARSLGDFYVSPFRFYTHSLVSREFTSSPSFHLNKTSFYSGTSNIPGELTLPHVDNFVYNLKNADITDFVDFFLLHRPSSNIPGEPTPCLFSGALDGDQDSLVIFL